MAVKIVINVNRHTRFESKSGHNASISGECERAVKLGL